MTEEGAAGECGIDLTTTCVRATRSRRTKHGEAVSGPCRYALSVIDRRITVRPDTARAKQPARAGSSAGLTSHSLGACSTGVTSVPVGSVT